MIDVKPVVHASGGTDPARAIALDDEVVEDTLGAVLKYQDDMERLRGERAHVILAEVQAEVDGHPPTRGPRRGS